MFPRYCLLLRFVFVMIDWFRGEIPFQHLPLPAGRLLSVNADGSFDWECVKRLDVRGSYESAIFLRSVGAAGFGYASGLMIDGNISKFLQGHNIVGSRDLNRLVYLAFEKIYQQHEEHFHGHSNYEMTLARIKRGDYLVKMLDINQFYDVQNDSSVEAWLHSASQKCKTRHGRATRDKGTVYLGKHSRRWSMKFYNKFREINALGSKKGHELPEELPKQDELIQFTVGKLRAEFRIHSKELEKIGITHGHHVNPDKIAQIFNIYMGKVEMTNQVTLIDEQLTKLPRAIQSSYQLWRQGVDLQNLLPKTTFYRHRILLKEFGIDLLLPPAAPDVSNVIPMIRVIEAVPVSTPSWVYEAGLIAA